MKDSVIVSWLLLLYGYFKKSVLYRLFDRCYRAVSNSWKNSAIIGHFRKYREDGELFRQSATYKVVCFPLWLIDKIKVPVRKSVKNSAIIRQASVCLDNVLALNTRFFGLMAASFGVVFALGVVLARRTVPAAWVWVFIAASALLSLLDVNVMSQGAKSFVMRFVGFCLGEEICYNFFDEEKTNGRLRLLWAVLLGAAGGAVSVLVSPLLGVLAVIGIFGFCLMMKSTLFAVVITVCAAPILPTMLVAGLCILCFLSLLAKSIMDEGFTWRVDVMGALVLVLLVVFGISGGLFSYTMGKSLQIWAIYFVFMLFYFVVVNIIRSKRQLLVLFKLFTLSALLVSLVGFYQYIFNIAPQNAWTDEAMFEDIRMRAYGTLENPNVLGEYLLLAIPIAFLATLSTKNYFSKFLFGCATLVLCGAMILTQSRGCWIGLVFAIAIIITMLNGRLWGLGVIALLAAPFFLPESVMGRLTSIGNMEDSSSSYRRFIWLGSIAMLADYWLMGVGLGEKAYNMAYPLYEYHTVVAPHSHNLFLQVWLDTGLAGFVLLVAVFVLFFKLMVSAFKKGDKRSFLSRAAVMLSAGVAGFIIQSVFDYTFYNYRVMLVFWIVIALGMCVKNLAAQEKVKEAVA